MRPRTLRKSRGCPAVGVGDAAGRLAQQTRGKQQRPGRVKPIRRRQPEMLLRAGMCRPCRQTPTDPAGADAVVAGHRASRAPWRRQRLDRPRLRSPLQAARSHAIASLGRTSQPHSPLAGAAAGGLRAPRPRVLPRPTESLMGLPPAPAEPGRRNSDPGLTEARKTEGRAIAATATNGRRRGGRHVMTGAPRTGMHAARAHPAAAIDGREETVTCRGRNRSRGSTR